MKKMMLAVLVCAAALSGCTTESQRIANCTNTGVSLDTCYKVEHDNQNVSRAAALQNAYQRSDEYAKQYDNKHPHHGIDQHAQAAHVADPLREASFSANGIKATVSNGFFTATINGKKATVKRFNANAYEIKGAGYVLSITLDENGITDASWNKTHGRDNGLLQVVQK